MRAAKVWLTLGPSSPDGRPGINQGRGQWWSSRSRGAPQPLRRLTESSNKSAPHSFGIAEPGDFGYPVDRVASFFNMRPRRFKPQLLDRLGRCHPGLGDKGASEVTRAHGRLASQSFDR
jgi:hypothetical protein